MMVSTEVAIEQTLEKAATSIVARRSSAVSLAQARWWRRSGTKRRGFRYETPDGKRITDDAPLERIKALVIPPAWTDVYISPAASSSLQAIGTDGNNRVQRLYHSSFAARQQRRKYAKVERFGEHLAALRRTTNEHIALDGLPRERVLAVIVRLINDLYFRVGSEMSVERYRTYGVTTLRNRHLEIKRNGTLVFNFVGKHHVRQRRIIVDRDLAALMRDVKAIGGSRLFNYIDADGRTHPITPRDVNDYIKAATSPEFSAKDFRTWGGTLLAAVKLAELGAAESEKQIKRNMVQAVKAVAERLGNTPTVCRGSYIHPIILKRYEQGVTLDQFRPRRERRIRRDQPEYEVEELALLRLLHAEAAKNNGTVPTPSVNICEASGA